MTLLDSHVHLGATADGRPIKIGAGRTLTLERVAQELPACGVDIAAVVDLGTTRGLAELERLLAAGELLEAEDGAFRKRGGRLLLPALEAEFRLPPAGAFHLLAYAPGLEGARALAGIYREAARNPALSTQRLRLSPADFRRAVAAAGGVLVVAHAFTPHRGLLGVGLNIAEVFPDRTGMGLELGLSADVAIAQGVGAIGSLGLLGGSDAHGPLTIGRELNELQGPPGFGALRRLVQGEAATIYGMHPAFGKYHRSYCLRCQELLRLPPPQLCCPRDPGHALVVGVLDRARSMAPPQTERSYPRYRYQLPLQLLPGFGAAARQALLQAFGSIHRALQLAAPADLARVVGAERAQAIVAMREGAHPSTPGGGGIWGRARERG